MDLSGGVIDKKIGKLLCVSKQKHLLGINANSDKFLTYPKKQVIELKLNMNINFKDYKKSSYAYDF